MIRYEYSVVTVNQVGYAEMRDGKDLKVFGSSAPIHEFLNQAGRDSWRVVGTFGDRGDHIILERAYEVET